MQPHELRLERATSNGELDAGLRHSVVETGNGPAPKYGADEPAGGIAPCPCT